MPLWQAVKPEAEFREQFTDVAISALHGSETTRISLASESPGVVPNEPYPLPHQAPCDAKGWMWRR